jgi:hypothetical protein
MGQEEWRMNAKSSAILLAQTVVFEFGAYLTTSEPRGYFCAFLIAPIFLLKGVQHWLKGELPHKV